MVNLNDLCPQKNKLTTRDIGQHAESRALRYLIEQGLTLVCRNYYTPHGEIDLIVLDTIHACLIFVEVRYRRHSHYGFAAETITKKKQHRLIQSTLYFLQHAQPPRYRSTRFDVMTIDANDQLDWIKNAFTVQ